MIAGSGGWWHPAFLIALSLALPLSVSLSTSDVFILCSQTVRRAHWRAPICIWSLETPQTFRVNTLLLYFQQLNCIKRFTNPCHVLLLLPWASSCWVIYSEEQLRRWLGSSTWGEGAVRCPGDYFWDPTLDSLRGWRNLIRHDKQIQMFVQLLLSLLPYPGRTFYGALDLCRLSFSGSFPE